MPNGTRKHKNMREIGRREWLHDKVRIPWKCPVCIAHSYRLRGHEKNSCFLIRYRSLELGWPNLPTLIFFPLLYVERAKPEATVTLRYYMIEPRMNSVLPAVLLLLLWWAGWSRAGPVNLITRSRDPNPRAGCFVIMKLIFVVFNKRVVISRQTKLTSPALHDSHPISTM